MSKLERFILWVFVAGSALAGGLIGSSQGLGGFVTGGLIGAFIGWVVGVNLISYLPILFLLLIAAVVVSVCGWLSGLR